MQIEEIEFKKFLTINQALAENSVKTYIKNFRILKKWIEDNNLELNHTTLVSFLFEKRSEEKLKNSTVNSFRQTIIHLDKYSKLNGLSYGFSDDIKHLPKIKPEVIFLSQEEEDKLLSVHINYKKRNGFDCENLDFKYLTLIWFYLITGSRYNEAASLKIKNLDIGNGKAMLVNTKNRETRYIYFDGPIKESLNRLVIGRDENDLVFTNSKGTKVGDGIINDDLKRRAVLAGITKHVHIHTLRHTFATLMYKETRDIALVSRLLGHKDIRVTIETYVHLVDDDLKIGSRKHPLIRRYADKKERIFEAVEAIKRLDFREEDGFTCINIIDNNTLKIKISF